MTELNSPILGISPVLILIMGNVYVLCSLIICSDAQKNLGINPQASFSTRLLVMMAGISPYMLMIVLYNYFFNSEQLLLWGGFAVTGVASAGLLALCGYLWARHVQRGITAQISIRNAFAMLFMGALVVLGEFLFFGTPKHPF